MQSIHRESERGFVLATSLVMLSLLSLLSVAMFFSSRSASQVSSSVQNTTEGHYYAETAINYVIWAMRNDTEFDAFDYQGSPVNDPSAVNPSVFPALATPTNAANVGDWSELVANLTNPGPTAIADSGNGVTGQVMYFDNTPLSGRALVWPTAGTTYPTLYQISTRLPRYIRLDIASNGNVTPSIPALPHANPPVVGADIPNNGAVTWMTTGNTDWDFYVDPTLALCTAAAPSDALACGETSDGVVHWLRASGVRTDLRDQFGVVVYAIGYVDGKPTSIIRAQIK